MVVTDEYFTGADKPDRSQGNTLAFAFQEIDVAGSFHPLPGTDDSGRTIRRPLRDLLAGLPLLPVTPAGEPDYARADPDVLVHLAESVELVLQIGHDGLAAIGLLYAHAAHRIADGVIGPGHIAALGRLQVELCEALSHVYRLGTACRQYTSDYTPREDGDS
jgi:hypothetical protein